MNPEALIFLSDPVIGEQEAHRGEIFRQLLHKGPMLLTDLQKNVSPTGDHSDYQLALQRMNNFGQLVYITEGVSTDYKVNLTPAGRAIATQLHAI
jgi:hypothetical protein